MPKYTLPKVKKAKKGKEGATVEVYDDLEWMRKVELPVNKEILGTVQVGDVVEIKLVGKVHSMSSRENESSPERSDIGVTLSSVEMYEENAFTKMSREED